MRKLTDDARRVASRNARNFTQGDNFLAEPTLPDAGPNAGPDLPSDSRLRNTAGAAPESLRGDAQAAALGNSEAAGDMSEVAGAGGRGSATSRQLTAGDARVLLLWMLLAVIGAGVAYRYFFRAFPEAAVNFKVTRSAALVQARAFATAEGTAAQGAGLADYQSTIVFNVDDDENLPRARGGTRRGQSPDVVITSERLVLGRTVFQAAAERGVSRSRRPGRAHRRLWTGD